MRLIDADKLPKKKILHYRTNDGTTVDVYAVFEKDIESAETIDAVTVVHGHWTDADATSVNVLFRAAPRLKVMSRRCSECGRISYDLYDYGGYKEMAYCSRCGARMDGAE